MHLMLIENMEEETRMF